MGNCLNLLPVKCHMTVWSLYWRTAVSCFCLASSNGVHLALLPRAKYLCFSVCHQLHVCQSLAVPVSVPVVAPVSVPVLVSVTWDVCRQWSWPVRLPVQFLGIFPTGGTITHDDQDLPWSDELEHKIFISSIGESLSISAAEPQLYQLLV